jgi:hypothetical protein
VADPGAIRKAMPHANLALILRSDAKRCVSKGEGDGLDFCFLVLRDGPFGASSA